MAATDDATNNPAYMMETGGYYSLVVSIRPSGSRGAQFVIHEQIMRFLGAGESLLKLLTNWSHMVPGPGGSIKAILRPKQIYQHPEGTQSTLLALCDGYNDVGDPVASNSRYTAAMMFKNRDVASAKPRFHQMNQDFMFVQDGCSGPQGLRPWDFKHASPDKDDVDKVIQAISEGFAHAGIQGGDPSTFLAGHDLCIARFSVQDTFQPIIPIPETAQGGILLADHVWTARYIAEMAARKHKLKVFDPNMIPGLFKEAGITIRFSTEPMRNPRGYEATCVAVDKLEMRVARLSGEGNSHFKICANYDGKGKPIEYFIEVFIPPYHEMDPYKITSWIAETVLLWKPTIPEVLLAKSHTNPFLRAVRLTWNKLKSFWTCSCSASA